MNFSVATRFLSPSVRCLQTASLLYLLCSSPLVAESHPNFSIPTVLGERVVELPVRIELTELDDGDPGIQLTSTITPIYGELLTELRKALPDAIALRTLEIRRWGDNGLSIKPLLTLRSCLNSNASVRGNFSYVIEGRNLVFTLVGVEPRISNDLCRTAANLADVQSNFEEDASEVLSSALEEPIGIDNLPEPYNALPLAIVDLRFTGADQNFGAIMRFRQIE